jgi:hypothetical protein
MQPSYEHSFYKPLSGDILEFDQDRSPGWNGAESNQSGRNNLGWRKRDMDTHRS